MTYDLIIIGAGAAGLFAAANIPPGTRTLLLEKTASPGQKLLLTGNGQCNLTAEGNIADFLTRYGPNGKRLRPVLYPFSNRALMAWFETEGLPLTVRADGKVFPASLNAHDVLNLLLAKSRENGVELHCNTPVSALTRLDAHYQLETPSGPLAARHVLVATGGASFPYTGSDGSFFAPLEALGLTVTPRRPSLAPVYVHDYPYSGLSGISFSDCGLTIEADGKPLRKEGGLLLTHRGFSGPLILNNARSISQGQTIALHYLQNADPATLRRKLIEAATGEAKQILTLLEAETGLPRRFLEVICQRADILPDTKAARLGGPELGRVASLLTADRYTVSGVGGFASAMATAGGVSLDEVDLRTMAACRYPGLTFAGEVLDVDGDTGGYNLQFAFSSAKAAVDAI
ncbi:MAG: aminoacetone oxidase family FAD-binding enzyme [Oscillospiraceae bacterium]|nr:aminoacetone oxidase family FAD-binding enzyme [Oscillospiraceae bacterium]